MEIQDSKELMKSPQKIISTNSEEMQSFSVCIRENLLKFSSLYNREINPVLVPIWLEALRGYSEDVIEAAFAKVRETFSPTAACTFPTPAHVMIFVRGAEKENLDDDAETAWKSLLNKIEAHYHPDLGWKGLRLTSRMDHAARAASGVHYISQCSESDLIWCKKRFIECYLRDEKLDADIPSLLRLGEGRKLLEDFATTKALSGSSGIVEVTEEMRARAEEKKQEAMRKFSAQ
jgi:hypothetical protein